MEWWENFFDPDWKRFSFDAICPELTRKQVSFITDVMGFKKDDRILDLCCGIGRHALELSRRGFARITGQDLTQEYLDEAITRAKKEGLNANFIQGDMRELPFEAEFDAIYNYHTSFGYFESETDNGKVIASVARALRSGGRFLLDTVNRDWIVRNFTSHTWHGKPPNYILERNRFDLATSTHHGEWTFVGGGKTKTRSMRLRMYSLHEMICLLERNGLVFKEAWGNMEKEPLTWDHHRLIVLAVKED